MRIEYLEYLLHVAKTKSINTSAKKLYISQQSLSKALKTLEQELGVVLLERHHYGVELTEAGRLAAERAKIISDQARKMEQELAPFVQRQVSTIKGNLRIGVAFHLMNAMLYDIIGSFSKSYPNVGLRVGYLELEDLLKALQDDYYDIGLMGFWYQSLEERDKIAFEAVRKQLIYEELYRSEIIVCINREWSLAQEKVLTPQKLVKYHLLESTYPGIIEKIFEETGGWKRGLETVSAEMFKQMVTDGLGYGFIDELDWAENYTFWDKEKVTAIPLAVEDVHICYGLIYHAKQIPKEEADAFCRMVREKFNHIELKLGK